VVSVELCLLESSARRDFKKMAGQNNHFLITILVGLAAVESGAAVLPDGMRVSWAPHDRASSAARSREFATKALLAWLTDALSAYVRASRLPPRIANSAVEAGIAHADADDGGLAGRVRAVAAAIGQAGSPEAVLVDVAIAWRNRLVHQTTARKLSKPLANAARAHAAQFTELYQGLRIDDLITRAEHRPAAAPTLKEITAIVRAAHKLVEGIDGVLLQGLDLDPYLREILRQHLMDEEDTNPKNPMIRASKIWSKSLDRRKSAIIQIAYNNGFTRYHDGAPNKLLATTIDALADMSPAEAVAELTT
jgi:hypothetical protein